MVRLGAGVAAILLATMHAPSIAGILVDTGPQFGDGGGGDTISTTQYLSGQFTVSSATTISDVRAYIASYGANQISLNLYADSSGLPGSSLFAASFVSNPNSSNGAWQGVSGLDWAVSPGTYWLSIENLSGSEAYAPDNVPNPLASYAYKVGDQPWARGSRFGLRVSDYTIVGTVPEPSTWLTLVIGFGFVGYSLRIGRRRQLAPIAR